MVSSEEAMRGAFLLFASEAAQIEGRDDCHAREYAVIRSDDLDAAVIETIGGALALCGGTIWPAWLWVKTEAELHAAYVQASCAGAAVVVFQGMPAVRAVATPRAARVALRN